MQGRNRPGVLRQRRAGRGDGRFGLANMHDAFGENKMGAERFGRPEQRRIPKCCFPRDQRVGMPGAIEQQIGLKIFREILFDGFDPVDHGIDDAVGKSRHRHGQGID